MSNLYSILIDRKYYVVASDNIIESFIKFKNMFPNNHICEDMIKQHNNYVCISVGNTYCYICESGVTGICDCASKLRCE